MMRDLLIVLGAAVLVILSSAWWPAIGRAWWDWRLRAASRKWVMPAWTGPDSPQTPVPVDDPDDEQDEFDVMTGRSSLSDDDWADQLHRFNQLGKFGDLTRPIAHQTHYEVEAVIRQLRVPDWVPERWRVAA